ncbi:uncharacterized protein K441DRAFT_660998 [Cenococcum geophilum 1.58]|uniref:uncharacterized protein n=1 Tax=Cenococcum geophilum 1.58 TaxID=794803 RepID=UPI00358E6314|nr:hypothetical protein K441DRAFT_660998 [Cenococcum geophilum 1.58]
MDSFFAPLRSTKSNLLPPGNCPSRPLGYPSDVRRRGSPCAVLLIHPPCIVRRLALTIEPDFGRARGGEGRWFAYKSATASPQRIASPLRACSTAHRIKRSVRPSVAQTLTARLADSRYLLERFFEKMTRKVSIPISKGTPSIEVIQGFLTTVPYLIHPILSLSSSCRSNPTRLVV